MSFYDLIISRRSIRQFKPESISKETLIRLVDAARLAPSAANRQPLEFIVVHNKKITKRVFPCLSWAGYIVPEGNPKPGQEPVAYIVVLVNTEVRKKGYEWDVGAAMENMILAAWERGVGSCWIFSVDRDKTRAILRIPKTYNIDSILALGYPAEEPILEVLDKSVKYWKDMGGRLHVPKRKLKDVIHFDKF